MPDRNRHITTFEFNELTKEKFGNRLKQANFTTKLNN